MVLDILWEFVPVSMPVCFNRMFERTHGQARFGVLKYAGPCDIAYGFLSFIHLIIIDAKIPVRHLNFGFECRASR